MPNKKGLSGEEDKKLSDYLIRQPHGDVAEYKRDTHPERSVFRSTGSKTLVPQGGEIDQALKPSSEIKDASEDNGVRMMADGGMVDDPEDKIQDSSPAHSPEDLNSWVQGQETQASKYGPEEQKAVLDQILKERGGIGRNIGRGVAAFTDTAGPAFGAGTGTLHNLDEHQNEMDKARLEQMPALQAMNEKQMGQKQALEGMTSSSPLGGSQTAPLAAFFEKVGIPKDQIPGMLQNPAAAAKIVEPFATLMSNQEKIQMEALLKQMELNQRGAQLGVENKKAEADIQARKEAQKLDATKQLSSMPWYSRLLHPGVSHELSRQAGLGNDSEDKSGQFAEDVLNYAKKHNITPEAANQIKLKRTGGK